MKELPSRSLKRSEKKRKAVIALAAGGALLLAAGSIAAGTVIVPSDFEVPVLLANGEVITQPWRVTADGKQVALVDSQEDAREVVKEVEGHYKSKETVDIEIEEQTSAEEMNLKNGDEKPEILTVEEAAERITAEEELTVKTTEVVTEAEPVTFEKITKKTDQLYEGETKVKQEGRDGLKEVTKKVVKENGHTTEETVMEETVLQEPEAEVTLAGTKEIPEEAEPVAAIVQKDGDGQLLTPVSGYRMTSGFGPRWGRTHLGVDLALPTGSKISAADSGTVIFSGYEGGYGNLVKIDHGNGIVTYYAHCSELRVEQGQAVTKGQAIAAVGSTGNSTGPHLHFEVRVDGKNVDPMSYL